MDETKNIKVMEQCPNFSRCSAPICPLDFYADERVASDPFCIYTRIIKRKKMPVEILRLVPEKNKHLIAHQSKSIGE